MNFKTWLDTFVEEKQLNIDQIISVDGPSGENIIPMECLLESMKQASSKEKRQIKNIIVEIDFKNSDIIPFFKHYAQRIAI